jgi:hypothetical protein
MPRHFILHPSVPACRNIANRIFQLFAVGVLYGIASFGRPESKGGRGERTFAASAKSKGGRDYIEAGQTRDNELMGSALLSGVSRHEAQQLLC